MTKTFIHTALAAVAALTLIPAMASAQPANSPARKPVAAERKIEPAKPAGPQAKRPDHKGDHMRPGPQAKREGHGQQFADRRGDRDHQRLDRDHDRKGGDHGKHGDHKRGDQDKRDGDTRRG
jgi:hypothetical protein